MGGIAVDAALLVARKPWMAALPGSNPGAMATASRAVSERLDADPSVQRIATPRLEMFAVRDFLGADECATLAALIDAEARPSAALRDDSGETRRTSFTCRFGGDHPLVNAVDRRIVSLLGIEPAHSEPLQGQRYQPGQEFKTHNDYFASGQSYSAAVAREGGQRTWTAMAYLNRPEGGGETIFPKLPIAIPATPGVLLIWNNLASDGLGNPFSHHAGGLVTAGTKYVVTKWFRERAFVEQDGASQ